jgi:tripartite-type tricarboxylate transporter receptor subunit TctC
MQKILRDPAIVQKFYAAGGLARPMSPEEFSAYLAKEEATWMPIIKSANIRAQ